MFSEKVDTLIKAAAATVEEIVHVAMPEKDKRDATLPRPRTMKPCSFWLLPYSGAQEEHPPAQSY